MKKPMTLNEQLILRYAEKFRIPKEDCYELDTSYVSYLFSLDTNRYKRQIKNHYQPLQALYYNKSGQLVSFHINCYAGGFPNLNWNRNQTMASFPPKQQAPIDSILPLSKQLRFLRPLSQNTAPKTDNYDYIVIVYWSRFMDRQSKRLLGVVQDNCRLSGPNQVKILYANNDNIFSAPRNKIH